MEGKDLKVRNIQFKDSEDVYEFPLLKMKDNRRAFALATSLLLPVVSVVQETYTDHLIQLGISPEDLDKLKEEIPEDLEQEPISFFDATTVVAAQLATEEFDKLLDLLVPSLKINGKEVDIEDAFQGDFEKYLLLCEYSFKENVGTPLVKWLEEKGLGGIDTYLRGAAKIVKETLKV